MKNSNFKMLVVLSPIFAADQEITFVYNFVAPLISVERIKVSMLLYGIYFNMISYSKGGFKELLLRIVTGATTGMCYVGLLISSFHPVNGLVQCWK